MSESFPLPPSVQEEFRRNAEILMRSATAQAQISDAAQKLEQSYKQSDAFKKLSASIEGAKEAAQAAVRDSIDFPKINRALSQHMNGLVVDSDLIRQWVRNVQSANPEFDFTPTEDEWSAAHESEPAVFEAITAEDISDLSKELRLSQEQMQYAIWLLVSLAYIATVFGIGVASPVAAAAILVSEQYTGYPAKLVNRLKPGNDVS